MDETENDLHEHEIFAMSAGKAYLMSPLPGRHGDRNDIIDFDVLGDDGEPMIVSLGFIPTLRTVKGKRMDRRLRNDLKDALMRYIMGLGEDASAGAECESEAKLQ